MKNKPRELAVLVFNRRKEIELSAEDLVWILAPNRNHRLHDQFCFFMKEDESLMTFKEFINGNEVCCEINKLSLVEVIARRETRQYEILVDLLLQNSNLKSKIAKIQKNVKEIFCTD